MYRKRANRNWSPPIRELKYSKWIKVIVCKSFPTIIITITATTTTTISSINFLHLILLSNKTIKRGISTHGRGLRDFRSLKVVPRTLMSLDYQRWNGGMIQMEIWSWKIYKLTSLNNNMMRIVLVCIVSNSGIKMIRNKAKIRKGLGWVIDLMPIHVVYHLDQF